MEDKKQTSNLRVEVEGRDGHSVWLPAGEVAAWRRGQEKLRQGDPEALKRLEQRISAGQRFVKDWLKQAPRPKD